MYEDTYTNSIPFFGLYVPLFYCMQVLYLHVCTFVIVLLYVYTQDCSCYLIYNSSYVTSCNADSSKYY